MKNFIKLLKIATSVLVLLPSIAPVSADMAPALDPPRICEVSGKGNKGLLVVGGPDLNFSGTSEELATDFPEQVPCPDGTGICSKWNYRYIWKGMNPDHAYADMSVDVALKSISHTGQIYPLSDNNADTRWIRWSSNDSTFDASFITSNATARSAAVGGKSGNFEGTCLIQGPGVAVTSQNERAQTVLRNFVEYSNSKGDAFCTVVDPRTQCEIPVNCDTREPIPSSEAIPISELLGINRVNGVDPVMEVAIPGAACPRIIVDNHKENTEWVCIQGFCFIF